MGIIKDFIEYRKVKRLVAEVENIEEEEAAKKQLDNILKKYPHLRKEFLNYAKESEQIEDEIIAETLTQNIETIVNKSETNLAERELLKDGVKFMEDNGEDFSDEYLNKVATAAGNSKHIDIEKEINLVKKFDNEEKQQKYVVEKLKNIYMKMDFNTLEADLSNKIKDLSRILEESSKKSKKISEWERKIIGKKIAFNYMKNGETHLWALSQVIPINKMFQMNMPQIVENEYKEIIKKEKQNIEGKEYKQYEQQKFRLTLLNEMAKLASYKYNETGEIIIPQSEQMRKISIEEEEFFIKKIDTLTNESLREDEIVLIRGRIRGTAEEMVKLEEITNMINSLPIEKRTETITQIKEIIRDEKSRKIYNVIKKVELNKSFENMDEKSMQDACKVFKQTLDARKEKEIKEKREQNSALEVENDNDEILI